MNANQAYDKILSDPDHFFKYYPICPAGPSGGYVPNTANLKQIKLYKKDAGMPGTFGSQKQGHFGATRPGMFGHVREISSWVINEFADPNATYATKTVNATGVPMIYYNDPNFNAGNMNRYLCDASGDGIMVTGQLSGCTFCILPTGNTISCIHVKPEGIGGTQLHNILNTQGRFNGYNLPVTTWGRNDYPAYSNVFGVRKGGRWSFYAQLSNDTFKTITAAYKIFPGTKRLL